MLARSAKGAQRWRSESATEHAIWHSTLDTRYRAAHLLLRPWWLVAAALLAMTCLNGCALLVGGAVAGGAAGTVAAAKEDQDEHHSPAAYAGTVLANVVYFPAKVLFAGAGAVTSGAAYVVTLGNSATSNRIWEAAVDGDYIVTPDVVEGDRPVHFVGPRETTRTAERAAPFPQRPS